jgi:dCMP deaminase
MRSCTHGAIFVLLAAAVAETAKLRSEDFYIQVGACALRFDHSVAALGYNGAPPGIDIDWSNRDERRKRVLHAEWNCLKNCKPGEIWLLATSISPCSECVKQIAAYGIKKVVYRAEYERDSFAFELAKEFSIELTKIP